MRTVIPNKAFIGLILLCWCLGGVLFLSSELVRTRALILVERQDRYLAGAGVKVANPLGNLQVAVSPDLERLRESHFFTKRIVEPPSVTKVKQALGSIYGGMYFANIWDLFWYLDYVGAESAFYTALKTAIDSGLLRESDDCIKSQSCVTTDKAATINPDNAKRLFRYLRKRYVEKAIRAYEDLALDEAEQLVKDVAHLVRGIHFPVDSPPEVTQSYNAVLLTTAFLIKYNLTKRELNIGDIKTALKMGLEEEDTDGFDKIADAEIRQYMHGVHWLRNGCFKKASATFAQYVGKATPGLPLELFSFMAVRSFARPFVNISYLRLIKGTPNQIKVDDCGEEVDLNVYLTGFTDAERRFGKNYVQKGLIADIEFYRAAMPFKKERFDALEQELLEERQHPQTTTDSETKLFSANDTETGPLEVERDVAKGTKSRSEIPEIESEEVIFNDSARKFSWPVRGRVSADFGSAQNGGRNKGINLVAPEGALVRAAAGGVVAYTGSELKGYGKSMLVRHASGFVTAYAHLSEVVVKRGDKVLRGQTIAKVGQTGAVGSPQLHFEIRNGKVPVNPRQFLPTM